MHAYVHIYRDHRTAPYIVLNNFKANCFLTYQPDFDFCLFPALNPTDGF